MYNLIIEAILQHFKFNFYSEYLEFKAFEKLNINSKISLIKIQSKLVIYLKNLTKMNKTFTKS